MRKIHMQYQFVTQIIVENSSLAFFWCAIHSYWPVCLVSKIGAYLKNKIFIYFLYLVFSAFLHERLERKIRTHILWEHCSSLKFLILFAKMFNILFDKRYNGKWSPNMLADYSWTLVRETSASDYKRQKKPWQFCVLASEVFRFISFMITFETLFYTCRPYVCITK